MRGQWHGGKGSTPRKGEDKKKFAEGWDAIWGKKKEIPNAHKFAVLARGFEGIQHMLTLDPIPLDELKVFVDLYVRDSQMWERESAEE